MATEGNRQNGENAENEEVEEFLTSYNVNTGCSQKVIYELT